MQLKTIYLTTLILLSSLFSPGYGSEEFLITHDNETVGYVVRAGAFKSYDNANRLAISLGQTYQVGFEVVSIDSLYRVISQPFSLRNEAGKLSGTLKMKTDLNPYLALEPITERQKSRFGFTVRPCHWRQLTQSTPPAYLMELTDKEAAQKAIQQWKTLEEAKNYSQLTEVIEMLNLTYQKSSNSTMKETVLADISQLYASISYKVRDSESYGDLLTKDYLESCACVCMEFIKNFPESKRIPEVLLRWGYSRKALAEGNTIRLEKARQVFQILEDKYSNQPEAAQAALEHIGIDFEQTKNRQFELLKTLSLNTSPELRDLQKRIWNCYSKYSRHQDRRIPARLYIMYAETHYFTREHQKLVNHCNNLIQLYPEFVPEVSAALKFAALGYTELKQDALAKTYHQKIIDDYSPEKYPDKEFIETNYYTAMYESGIIYMKEGDITEALRRLKIVETEYPGTIYAHISHNTISYLEKDKLTGGVK